MNNYVSKTARFPIICIHYGTLIAGKAMRNIQGKGSIVSNNDEFGIIAHNLLTSGVRISFYLNIDTDKKKLAITGAVDLSSALLDELCNELEFEWNFRE